MHSHSKNRLPHQHASLDDNNFSYHRRSKSSSGTGMRDTGDMTSGPRQIVLHTTCPSLPFSPVPSGGYD
ncbi:uncharacterized protein LACBIDRAFT_304771 [Laccaria bicolor S238N-H82]|uniref:Predicted protein n=1 Tax=Laccaria bicolor (strain S238N-H82 / ATCC MYA-4686) TaxID=486041 RepID=B0DMA8_LACBS|nr:uncharacterized protein LACBIDRAFT_304771 [Laccaria bicolor S238N-H82]EDR04248.1 predicted protein [Laccaria bicolor S238N-H82]|eukprot:XP_001885139.1 predicted protein [Laccaria bicolor S238N-H82]